MKTKKFLNKEQWDNILNRVKNGEFYNDIAKEYGITGAAITYQAKKIGINNDNRFKRKNKLNDSYFEVINSEHKAYWLGFIMADGGVCYTTKYYEKTKSPNRLYFALSIKDKVILENFCNDLEYDQNNIINYIPKGTYSDNIMCKLNINSKKLCNSLKQFNIIPKKTGFETFPELSKELMPHFIRGFFDGDGSVWKSNNRKFISFTGNENFLLKLKNYLYENKIIDNNDYAIKKYKDKDAYDFKFAKKESIDNFFKYLYSNSTIHLDRKYNKFL